MFTRSCKSERNQRTFILHRNWPRVHPLVKVPAWKFWSRQTNERNPRRHLWQFICQVVCKLWIRQTSKKKCFLFKWRRFRSCGKCPSRQGSESSKLTHENNIATVTERNNNSLNCPRQFTIDDLQSTKYHGSSNSIYAPDSRNSAESRNKLRQAQNNSISDQTTSEVVNNYEPSG